MLHRERADRDREEFDAGVVDGFAGSGAKRLQECICFPSFGRSGLVNSELCEAVIYRLSLRRILVSENADG